MSGLKKPPKKSANQRILFMLRPCRGRIRTLYSAGDHARRQSDSCCHISTSNEARSWHGQKGNSTCSTHARSCTNGKGAGSTQKALCFNNPSPWIHRKCDLFVQYNAAPRRGPRILEALRQDFFAARRDNSKRSFVYFLYQSAKMTVTD